MNSDEMAGRILGGYRILRRVGQGGMATVYQAHEESLNRVVALKVVHRHLSAQGDFVERFKREARAAASLSHPNIVQIYAIGEADGSHYFSMEYVKGRTLADLIGSGGSLSLGQAVPILAQVARALRAAHAADIVHRDIKPANILLDEAGHAKVVDFGIAEVTTESRLTRSGMLFGTPDYLSPEQCLNEPLDGRSDVYALGVTSYQMFSGRVPFQAKSPTALVLQITEGRAPTLGELDASIPRVAQDIVARMMAVDPDRRFQSADALLETLEAIDVSGDPDLQGQPAPAAVLPVAPSGRMSKGGGNPQRTEVVPSRRAVDPTDEQPATRFGLVAVLVVLVLLTVGALASPWSPFRGSSQANEAMMSASAAGVDVAELSSSNGANQISLSETPIIGIPSGGGPIREPDIGATTSDVTRRGEPEPIAVDPRRAVEEPVRNAPLPEASVSDRGTSATAPGETETFDRGVPATALLESAVPDRRLAATAPAEPASDRRVRSPAFAEPVPPAASAQPDRSAVLADDTVVAETRGDYAYVDLVNAWIEQMLADQRFAVVDFPSSSFERLQQAARFHVVTTVELLSTRPLEFFGRVETQYTAMLTMRATDLANGAAAARAVTGTVSYTAINLEENLQRATRDLARTLIRELRSYGLPQ